ncbi:Mitochondrial distribution and morphology protein 12 [Emydomyces testavorans]|uniref:Mitochondrial distribution and morphology protein 12 n=1 Tax=Emydomyces testavorans TaxID=2070801 RepID=A0AAF0DAC3_9EURO|nr:Mitochondrial distribution and morphology protein 12 [Emydomyces testavorans]
MSIDINWEAATSGPDGEALAERIRSFIHEKFQQIALPRFIRSVEVNSFDFGTVSPELQIKDLCDPFEDFYEEDEDEEAGDSDLSDREGASSKNRSSNIGSEQGGAGRWQAEHPRYLDERLRSGIEARDLPIPSREEATIASRPAVRSPMSLGEPLNPYFFPRASTPGIPGGTSNLGHYYMPLSGISGTQTPLAPVSRSPFSPGLRDSSVFGDYFHLPARETSGRARRQSDIDVDSGPSRPSTADTLNSLNSHTISDPARPHSSHPHSSDESHATTLPHSDKGSPPPRHRMHERSPEDFQVLCRMRYNGDIRLSLTAQVLLDYPMPNFVGLPLKLNITGLTFDGVAVLGYIRKRIHFCFLCPEDADTLLGADDSSEPGHIQSMESTASGARAAIPSSRRRDGSLLRDIRVESEIGRKEDGKQVLKNVGKVEKFVLEQVRRIFEEEFVYPSFWTFLI